MSGKCPEAVQPAVDLIELLETNHIAPALPWRRTRHRSPGLGAQSSRKVGRPERPRRRHHVSTHCIEQGRAMLLGGLRRHRPSSRGLRRPVARPQRPASSAGGNSVSTPMASSAPPPTLTANTLRGGGRRPGGAASGLGRMRIAPQTYAIFLHQGHVATLPHTWHQALAWLAQSGYQSAQQPDFERYGACFDAATGSGEAEIWRRGMPKQALARPTAARAASAPSPRHRARSAPPQAGEGFARASPWWGQLHRAHRGQ